MAQTFFGSRFISRAAKTENPVRPETSQLHVLWRKCLCSCSLCFSLPLIFTLVNVTISHFLTAAIKFSRFSSNEIAVRCFFISRTSSFPVIHVIYTLKFSRKKDFLSLKVRAAVQFTAETGSVLEMQNFISTYMKGRTDGRTYGWTKSVLDA